MQNRQDGGDWIDELRDRLQQIAAEVTERYRSLDRNDKVAFGLLGFLVLANAGLRIGRKVMAKKIFIAFAGEDEWARDYLVGQGKNSRTPIEFKETCPSPSRSDNKLKTQCREVIKTRDGVIAMLSTHTRAAEGALWEMQCANDENVPMIGVHTDKDNKGAIPTELAGKKVLLHRGSAAPSSLRLPPRGTSPVSPPAHASVAPTTPTSRVG
jgi:hypothetical protein